MLKKLKLLKLDKRLYYILILAFVLILPRISQTDFLGDNAHYTIRSIGYVDHMFSDFQTTPLDWYDTFPLWANLSFHDHPFLLFFIQNLFLRIHESIFFAKLPYVLFSLATIVVVYLWARELFVGNEEEEVDNKFGEKVALWSALLLALNSIFLYNARTGFMEAGVVFFVVLSFYSFTLFLRNDKYWIFWGISFGLCLAAKYSAFFLIPVFAIYILLKKRDLLKNKKFYSALLIIFIFLLPSIIYNSMLFATRGHLDYQFSRLFHMEDSPWQAGGVSSIFGNPFSVFISLGRGILFPNLIIFFIGFIYSLFISKRIFAEKISFVFLTILFIITGANYNHLNLYTIFVVLFSAYFFVSALNWDKTRAVDFIVKTILAVFVFYLFFVAVNSHILIKPIFGRSEGWLISGAQSKNYGIYQIDKYLEKLIKENNILEGRDGYYKVKNKSASLIKRYGTSIEAARRPGDIFEQMVVYDRNLSWFGSLWPFQRRNFYHNLPVLSTEEFMRFSPDLKIKKIFFIKSTANAFLESENNQSSFPEDFEQMILRQGAKPRDFIYRTDGELAYKVYIFNVADFAEE